MKLVARSRIQTSVLLLVELALICCQAGLPCKFPPENKFSHSAMGRAAEKQRPSAARALSTLTSFAPWTSLEEGSQPLEEGQITRD